MFETEAVMKAYHLFWQYPVVTEKVFYQQEQNNPRYVGLPWATIIDKNYNIRVIHKLLKPYFKRNDYYTCCQHVAFHKLIMLFKLLGIRTVYTPHKLKNVDRFKGVNFVSCPLYAVNFEDKTRNQIFIGKDYSTIERPYLYSFIGAYNPGLYVSDIRKRILAMVHGKEAIVESTRQWHFEDIVYGGHQNPSGYEDATNAHRRGTERYNETLLESRYSLCPSGAGPSSIRLWESLATGTIPVLLADTIDLPHHPLWREAIIQIPESELGKIPDMLAAISPQEEAKRRSNCIAIYDHFKNNYANRAPYSHTLFTSYKCEQDDEIVKSMLKGWSVLNPSYRILYFSDNDVHTFFKETPYYDTFKQMRNGVAIADFFRICYINKHGGYWFDIDLSPIKVDIPDHGNVHLFDAGYKNISYMFIGGRPNQRLFTDVIIQVNRNILDNIKKKKHIMEITGPRVIQNIVCNKLNIKNADGCLSGKDSPELYLQDTDYEFVYKRLRFKTTKTSNYIKLQKKYNQKQYQSYDYV